MTAYSYLPYTLTLEAPAIITALGGDPNSSRTLPFIPGSAVRGAVARALGDPGTDVSKREAFEDLVLGGKVRYLHAYPYVDGRRALPVPLSFRQKKEAPTNSPAVEIFDLAAYDGNPALDNDFDKCWPQEQLKPLSWKFLTLGAAQPTLFQPSVSARIHNQRDRRKGRAWKDAHEITHGAVFAFESLDAGQSFHGMMHLRAECEEELDEIAQKIKTVLGDRILVGRSRRAGYGGLALIQWGSHQKREVEGAGKTGLRPMARDIARDETFRLLLTSACLVRHEGTGHVDPMALLDVIARRFGNKATVIRRRWAFEPIGGFNRTWRLEVPQVLAVSAGSVFVLKAEQDIPLADLQCIEHEGLGERKEEGYGRVLFLDAPMEGRFFLEKPKQTEQVSFQGGQPPKLVFQIEERILWAQVLRRIEEEAAMEARAAQNLPSNSLIGRLRTALRAEPDKAIATLQDWLTGDDETKRLKRPAMDQLERCRMDGGMPLRQWILRTALQKEEAFAKLRADDLVQQYHIVSESSAKQILNERFQDIAARFLDTVLGAMAVRNKTEEAGNER
ncbi:hypothetical protein [Desulfosoma sp.]